MGRAARSRSPGLRGRSTEGLDARAGRYVRLSARGGDGVYSVTELQVWTRRALAAPAAQRPPSCWRRGFATYFVYLVLAFGVVLFATPAGLAAPAGSPLPWLLPAIAALLLLRAIAAAWPLSGP